MTPTQQSTGHHPDVLGPRRTCSLPQTPHQPLSLSIKHLYRFKCHFSRLACQVARRPHRVLRPRWPGASMKATTTFLHTPRQPALVAVNLKHCRSAIPVKLKLSPQRLRRVPQTHTDTEQKNYRDQDCLSRNLIFKGINQIIAIHLKKTC